METRRRRSKRSSILKVRDDELAKQDDTENCTDLLTSSGKPKRPKKRVSFAGRKQVKVFEKDVQYSSENNYSTRSKSGSSPRSHLQGNDDNKENETVDAVINKTCFNAEEMDITHVRSNEANEGEELSEETDELSETLSQVMKQNLPVEADKTTSTNFIKQNPSVSCQLTAPSPVVGNSKKFLNLIDATTYVGESSAMAITGIYNESLDDTLTACSTADFLSEMKRDQASPRSLQSVGAVNNENSIQCSPNKTISSQDFLSKVTDSSKSLNETKSASNFILLLHKEEKSINSTIVSENAQMSQQSHQESPNKNETDFLKSKQHINITNYRSPNKTNKTLLFDGSGESADISLINVTGGGCEDILEISQGDKEKSQSETSSFIEKMKGLKTDSCSPEFKVNATLEGNNHKSIFKESSATENVAEGQYDSTEEIVLEKDNVQVVSSATNNANSPSFRGLLLKILNESVESTQKSSPKTTNCSTSLSQNANSVMEDQPNINIQEASIMKIDYANCNGLENANPYPNVLPLGNDSNFITDKVSLLHETSKVDNQREIIESSLSSVEQDEFLLLIPYTSSEATSNINVPNDGNAVYKELTRELPAESTKTSIILLDEKTEYCDTKQETVLTQAGSEKEELHTVQNQNAESNEQNIIQAENIPDLTLKKDNESNFESPNKTFVVSEKKIKRNLNETFAVGPGESNELHVDNEMQTSKGKKDRRKTFTICKGKNVTSNKYLPEVKENSQVLVQDSSLSKIKGDEKEKQSDEDINIQNTSLLEVKDDKEDKPLDKDIKILNTSLLKVKDDKEDKPLDKDIKILNNSLLKVKDDKEERKLDKDENARRKTYSNCKGKELTNDSIGFPETEGDNWLEEETLNASLIRTDGYALDSENETQTMVEKPRIKSNVPIKNGLKEITFKATEAVPNAPYEAKLETDFFNFDKGKHINSTSPTLSISGENENDQESNQNDRQKCEEKVVETKDMVSNFRLRDVADETKRISNVTPCAQLTAIDTAVVGDLTSADKTSKSSPDSGLHGNKDVQIIPRNDVTNIVESKMNEFEKSNISGDRAVDFFVMQPKEKFLLDWSHRQEAQHSNSALADVSMLDESVSVAKKKKRKKRKIITFKGSQSARKRSNISKNSCNISGASEIYKEPTNISKSVNNITEDLACTIENTPKFSRNNQSILKSQNVSKNMSILSGKSLKEVTNVPKVLSKSFNDNTADIVNGTNNKTKPIENSQRINESTKVLNSTSFALSKTPSQPTSIQKTCTITKKETDICAENTLKAAEKSQIDESMNISSNRHIVTRQRYHAMCKIDKQSNNTSKNSSMLISQSSREADQVLKNKSSISVSNETREDLDKSMKSVSQINDKSDKQSGDESRDKSKLAEAVENMEIDVCKISMDSEVATNVIADLSNLQNDVATDCGDPVSNEIPFEEFNTEALMEHEEVKEVQAGKDKIHVSFRYKYHELIISRNDSGQVNMDFNRTIGDTYIWPGKELFFSTMERVVDKNVKNIPFDEIHNLVSCVADAIHNWKPFLAQLYRTFDEFSGRAEWTENRFSLAYIFSGITSTYFKLHVDYDENEIKPVLKYCLEHLRFVSWLDEVSDILRNISQSKDNALLQEYCDAVNTYCKTKSATHTVLRERYMSSPPSLCALQI